MAHPRFTRKRFDKILHSCYVLAPSSKQACSAAQQSTSNERNRMLYFCIIFLPPVYFIARKKRPGFVLNSILHRTACLCILTLIGIFIAPLFWILAVGHAGFTYRRELVATHADLIATKMAEK